MKSKQSGLFISHMIAISGITVIIFGLNLFLENIFPNPYIRVTLLVGLATLIYAFLAHSIIDPFLQNDEKLADMIDQTLHELNTPIATIEANLNLLRRSIKDDKDQKRLERISEASKNLTKLYESIEYHIKENIEYVEQSTFDLHTTIDKSFKRFSELKKDIILINETKPMMLCTDQNGFDRVIDNLLSNAIKYNQPKGFVKFHTQDHKLYIKDSGIGIDTKNLFIVYEKSFQENPTTLGFGLGLSIVKNFCDKHKISIKFDTKKDQGTTVVLDLKAIEDK